MYKDMIKSMTSEELADIVRAINITGIAPTPREKEYLNEAADRLDRLHRVEQFVKGKGAL